MDKPKVIRPVNKIQTGKVVFLGVADDRQATVSTPVDVVEVLESGIAGNAKNMFVGESEEQLRKYLHSEVSNLNILENINKGKRPFYQHQICLLDTNAFEVIRRHNLTLNYGDAKEQIIVDGIDVNALHAGSTIKFGSVILEVISTKSTCAKLYAKLKLPAINSKEELKIFLLDLFSRPGERGIPHLGVFARVLQPGRINLNDTVVCDPSTSIHFNKNPFQIAVVPDKRNTIKGSMFRWFTEEEALAEYPESFHNTIRSAFKSNFSIKVD